MPSTGRQSTTRLARLAAPWYRHPALDPDAWRRLTAGTELAFAVVNVDSGPGPGDDPYYGPALAQGSRTRLVGYVNVDYGRRPGEQVLAEVADWRRRYEITAVMLDCVPAEPRAGHWSIGVIDELRCLGAGFVVLNPGRPPAPELIEAADVTCVAEYAWGFYESWTPPAYLAGHDPARQWHLIHDVPAEAQPRARELAGSRGAGLVWATSGALPDPWSVLQVGW